MSTQHVTFNLTPLFVLWTIIFGVWAWFASSWVLLIVALVPWLLIFGFIFCVWLLAVVTLGIMYLRGYPITLTTPRKGSRVVQRRK